MLAGLAAQVSIQKCQQDSPICSGANEGVCCSQAWLPDSPRWLLLSGAGGAAATAALARARGKYGTDSCTVNAEIKAMEESIAEALALDEDTGAL
jgi:hypothetical protein